MKEPLDKQLLAKQTLHNAIIPALKLIGLNSPAAQELVLGTGVQESGLIYRRQLFNGPARGLWQMEPTTFWDLWRGFVAKRPELKASLLKILDGEDPSEDILETNDQFAAAMCRVHYRRIPKALPTAGDIQGMAAYWKHYYNTYLGAGKPKEFVSKWTKYVSPDTFESQPDSVLLAPKILVLPHSEAPTCNSLLS